MRHDPTTGGRPSVTIGLPVYNGEDTLSEAVDSLLAQTFEDFELVISDNASTDATEEIGREYARADERVSFHRSPVNRGSSWNHNHLVDEARGRYFKWAADDDTYDPELLARCVEVLEADPGVVLCHSYVDDIDLDGNVLLKHDYPFRTDDPRPSVRYRDLLMLEGGHDLYAVVRTEVMQATPPIGSFHHYAERCKIASIALWGRFHQVPEILFHHREYPTSEQRTYTTSRAIAPVLDPRRRSRLLHPTVRLHAEYIAMFVRGIRGAPLSSAERRRVYQVLGLWLGNRVGERLPGRAAPGA
jgi:glycosyltransferase involved in cell wall biosynthesis